MKRTANIDYNGRLGMVSAAAAYKKAFGARGQRLTIANAMLLFVRLE